MDIVMGWLSKIDFVAVGSAAVTFILGLAMIKPRLAKAVAVIGDVADLLSCLKSALADGKVDTEEMKSIIKEAEELIAEFKK